MPLAQRTEARFLRKARIKKKLGIASNQRPRLSVFRSGKHIYAQIISDLESKTLVAASTLTKDLRTALKKTSTVEAAQKVGEYIAKKALEKNITKVCFDRNGYIYHGRVKALADAARASGLQF